MLDHADLKQRMQGALNNLKEEFNGLRAGRANVDLLAPVMVDAYGSDMPLNQVGTVGVGGPRSLTVQVWDKSMVAAVEKAITNSGLGLTPNVDGQNIRLNLPELNEERRTELVKLAKKYAEESRVAVRNVRRSGMDDIKKLEGDSEMSEDDARRESDSVQKLTDEFIKQIDEALTGKEQDIMTV